MMNRSLSKGETYDMLLSSSDDEEIVSELEDHISEASELFSAEDETENEFTDCTIYQKISRFSIEVTLLSKQVNGHQNIF